MDSFGGIISIFCDLGHPVFVVFDAWDHATIKQSILAAENTYSMAIYGQTRIVYSAVLKIGPWTWDTWGTSARERRGAQANHDRIRSTLVLGIFDLFWFCACGKPRLQLRSQVGANSNQSGAHYLKIFETGLWASATNFTQHLKALIWRPTSAHAAIFKDNLSWRLSKVVQSRLQMVNQHQ